MIEQLLHEPTVYAVGYAVLHSLWQGTLLAALLWGASRYFHPGAAARYRLAYGTLLLQLALTVATFWSAVPVAAPVLAAAPESAFVLGYPLATVLTSVTTTPNPLLSADFWQLFLALAWVVGLVIGSLRLGVSFGRVRRMRRDAQTAVPPALLARVGELARRLGYNGKLRLGISELATGPALVGHLRPLLLFPVALVNQLTTEEAETVILHELAHLRRNDHWWNLLQCLLEVLFYYHPAVHWISARIRQEREHCCDDLVLRYGPGRLAYARALLYFETRVGTTRSALALTEGGGLLHRIQRFINNHETKYQMKSRLFLLPALALTALVTTAAYTPAIPTEEVTTPATAVTDLAPARADHYVNPADTLPPGNFRVTTMRDGKTTKVRVENRRIKELEIDGRVIPPSEFPEHEPLVEELIGGGQRPGPYAPDVRQFYFHSDSSDRFGEYDGFPGFEGFEGYDGFEGYEGFRDFGGFDEIREKMEESMKQLNESMEQIFEFSPDGDGFSFRFNGRAFPDSLLRNFSQRWEFPDSLWRDVPRDYRFDNWQRDGGDRIYSEEELLRDLESEERELREMDDAIRRLEERKRAKERELRALRERERDRDGKARDDLRKSRDLLREQNDRRLEELREADQGRRDVLREQNDQRLAELRANNEARLNELRELRNVAPDYRSIVEQLQSEGMLSAGPLRRLVVTDRVLKFNGKRYDEATYARFAEIYEERYGKPLSYRTTIKVKDN